jgi:hypothetical protein
MVAGAAPALEVTTVTTTASFQKCIGGLVVHYRASRTVLLSMRKVCDALICLRSVL